MAIICYNLDFHKKEKEFDTLEDLLKELSGSPEQAKKALNNPKVSYRGFRLIETDKLPELMAEIVSERLEKIKNDYVDNITGLEKKIKEYQKSERKANIRLEAVEQDSEDEIKDLTKKHTLELETKERTFNNEKVDLIEKHEKVLANMKNTYVKELTSLSNNHEAETSELTKSFEKYQASVEKEVADYNKELEYLTEKYNNTLKGLYRKYENTLKIQLNEKTIFTENIEYYVNNLKNRLNALVDILNSVLSDEQREFTLDLESYKYIQKELNSKHTLLDYNKDTLSELPMFENKELVLTTGKTEHEVRKTSTAEHIVEVEQTKNNNSSSEPEKEPVKQVAVAISEPKPQALVVNGKVLKSEKEYDELSKTAKGNYLYDLITQSISYSDICKSYTTGKQDLTNDIIVSSVLEQSYSQKRKFEQLELYLNEYQAKELFKTISSTRKEYNDYFGLYEKKEVDEPIEQIITKQQVKKSPNDKSFDWVNFKEKLTESSYMNMVFKKDSVSLREASSVSEIPARQLSNMLIVLKKLGHVRKFANGNLLSTDELLLVIGTNGWFTASKKMKSSDTLESILTSIYPSWLEYLSKK